ncbi:MAG: DHH family phosphoesterase [Candidatus Paceibacterota bacterium]|jgi:single-stranded-DNA-specific exonuclease|nr:DHHA1 domain-containing protein [Candidatus Paceibacterota bacterium]MDD4831055.1 DHHA1 domain-containing protein [Candidatus Paceibacterota bacterium]MDD4875313.1 DHHA1 domain-containing protein [Candidatus Paceibacterota bacterium]
MASVKIKNLDKAAKRIKEAVKKREQIIIYADADVDGVSSAIILKESISNLASSLLEEGQSLPPIQFYFPNRKIEGYGLNKEALEFFGEKFPVAEKQNKKTKKPAGLLITLDCGITNFEEISKAKEMGFFVLLVDHHQILDKVPEADIIVDPNQKGDKSFKSFANAGLAFNLAKEILGDSMSKGLRLSFLELAALATIADMMPEIEENSDIILEGLSDIQNSQRPGIKVFFEIFSSKDFSSKRDLISKMISVLNAASVRPDHQHECYLLLTAGNYDLAKMTAEFLLEKSIRHREEVRGLEEEVKYIINSKNGSPIIFEGSKNWNIELLGAVASRIVREFQKPVFLYATSEETSRGSVRAPKGVDVVKAMSDSADLLEMFGGHPPAAGFTVRNDNLEKFKEKLIDYFSKKK